jgi:hypothetical protein
MLVAYMDESGIHDGAQVCVISGYWGGENQWKRFEPRWKRIIKDAGMNEFHSSKFWKPDGTRRGVYASWPDSKADKFITDLLACIGDYKIYPMSATLKVDAWKKLNKEERMFLTGGKYDLAIKEWLTPSAPNKTYFLPFQFCVVYPAMACKEHLKVHYSFDLNKQFKNHASDLFKLLKADENITSRNRIGELSLPTSEEAPGLQAADLLAYQTYQFSRVRIAQNKAVKISTMPPILRAALKNARDPMDFPFFDESGLNVALHNLPSDMRSEGWYPVKLKDPKLRRKRV